MSRFYNESTGMLVIIKPDKSYTLVGNTPDSVTDEELWDMAEGYAPDNWETVQRATPGSLQLNLAISYVGVVG